MDDPWAPGKWPVAVATGWVDYRQQLNLSRLDAIEKKLVWGCLQRTRPKLADLLKSETMRAMRETFGAEIMLDIDV